MTEKMSILFFFTFCWMILEMFEYILNWNSEYVQKLLLLKIVSLLLAGTCTFTSTKQDLRTQGIPLQNRSLCHLQVKASSSSRSSISELSLNLNSPWKWEGELNTIKKCLCLISVRIKGKGKANKVVWLSLSPTLVLQNIFPPTKLLVTPRRNFHTATA